MADILRLYKNYNINVPIRFDRIPLMAVELQGYVGYTVIGRLYAIRCLKGLMQAIVG